MKPTIPTIPFVLAALVTFCPVALAQSVTYSIASDGEDAEGTRVFAGFLTGESAEGAYLGVRLEEETESEEGGARVTLVVDGSPAAEAGLRVGDVVVGYGDKTIRGPLALTRRIHEAEPGDSVELNVLRDGRRRSIEVELGERKPLGFTVQGPTGSQAWVLPDVDSEALQRLNELRFDELKLEGLTERLQRLRGCEEDDEDCTAPMLGYTFAFGGGRPVLGVELVDTTPELRSHLGGAEDRGLLVGKVLAGTPADHGGVAVGDLIVEVGGDPVGDVGALRRALQERQGETFDLRVVRDGEEVPLQVTLPEPSDDRPSGPRA